MYFNEIFGMVGIGTRNNTLDFGNDADLHPGIIFALHLFVMCETLLLYSYSADVSTLMLMSLVTGLIHCCILV